MKPDVATLTVGAASRGTTAREAVDANKKAMTVLLGALERKGVGARDIQTGDLRLSPIYDQPPGQEAVPPATKPSKIIGYEINNGVTITIRDIAKVGEVVDAAAAAGANQIDGLSFSVDDSRAVRRDLRKKALADAREKAEEIAKETGMTLGLPIAIEVDYSPFPTYGFAPAIAAAPGVAPAGFPIAAGEQELSATVQVVYELRPAK